MRYVENIILCPYIYKFNSFNAKLNPICHLLVLLGVHSILHVSRIMVNIHCSSNKPFTKYRKG
jgi:hypothetical protein